MNLLYQLKKDTLKKDKFKEFCFTSDYIISFVNEDRVEIERKENLTSFYGKNIDSLKVVAGANGSGKSRLIKEIVESLILEESEEILIFEDNSEYYYYNGISSKITIFDNDKNKRVTLKLLKSELSNKFKIISISNSVELTSFTKENTYLFKNLTTTYYLQQMDLNRLILNDVNKQIKILNEGKLQQILNDANINLNNRVIIKLLLNSDYNNGLFKGDFFYNSRQIEIKKKFEQSTEVLDLYYLSLIYELFEEKEKIIFSPIFANSLLKKNKFEVNKIIKEIIAYLFFLDELIEKYDFYKNSSEKTEKQIFIGFYKLNKSTIDEKCEELKMEKLNRQKTEILISHLKKINRKRIFEIKYKLDDITRTIGTNSKQKNEINSIWNFETNILELPYKDEKVNYFLRLKQNFMTSSKLFIGWKSISSGEYYFLSIICRVIYELELNEGDKNYLLIFDESDLGFHPMWQKKWLKLVIDVLSILFPKANFQLIITTHSPFLLSDVLEEDVYLIQDGELLSSNKTFGANIHNLYQDNFFISGSKMGDFSKIKIDTMIKELTGENDIDKNKLKEFKFIINQIGEPILKRELERILQLKDKDAAIDYYKEKIKELGGDIFV